MIQLVYNKYFMPYFLLVEESVHIRDKYKQLFKALSEWHDEGHFVRAPGWVINRGLSLYRTGLMREVTVPSSLAHVS